MKIEKHRESDLRVFDISFLICRLTKVTRTILILTDIYMQGEFSGELRENATRSLDSPRCHLP